jgi:hypothetical protein
MRQEKRGSNASWLHQSVGAEFFRRMQVAGKEGECACSRYAYFR